LDDRAIDLLPELDHGQHSEILIRHLLTFTAVFDMGRPMASIARDEATDVLTEIFRAPLRDRPGTSYLYANTPSLLLGLIAERVTGRRLDRLAEEWFFQPLGMRHTTFFPKELMQREPDLLVAPTALDWRGEVRGEVHDPGAWSLVNRGHVPGHAGLFSTVPDLLRFVEMMLRGGERDGYRYFSPEMVEQMHTNQAPHLKMKVGLGWEIGRPEAQGAHVSDEAFGKTGFTGTSILMDPAKSRGMVLLSNRTYPEPQERAEILRVWRGLADIVFAD
jgi:CubicO group peptidase (beta-lactamase class C family)